MKKHKLTLYPELKNIEVDEQTSLLEAMKSEGVYIKSSCGGHASCGDCVVKIMEGFDFLSGQEAAELSLLGNVFHITKERLSCQTKISGDVKIDISSHDLASDQLKSRQKNFQKRAKTSLRKKADLEKKYDESKREKSPVNNEEQKKSNQGGKKRPKPFKT